MRTSGLVFGLIFPLVVAFGCSSLSVKSDWDPAADFSGFESWAWIAPANEASGHPLLRSPLLHERVRHAVEAELAARGYAMVAGDQADFRVGYHLSLDQKLDVYTIDRVYGYGRWGGFTYPETYVQEYQEGTLILDLVDARGGTLAWRGWASKPIYEQPSPEESERNVREAVAAILERFPPAPGEKR